MEVLELLNYVNKGLSDGKSVTSIGKELGLNESSIRKKLNKHGYKRSGNKFVSNADITSNITEVQESFVEAVEVKEPLKEESNHIFNPMELNIDRDKLNLLLNNVDKLLTLIPSANITSNITNYRSGNNRTISLRADSGLYEAIKERAARDKINIADIINRAIEDYLKNYI